MTNDEEFHCH
jgi:hypothetical protein